MASSKLISSHDEIRIAASAIVSVTTVRRVFAGGGNANSRVRVAAAARELGLPPPPERDETRRQAA